MTTIHDLKAWKADGRRFTMLTAYDFPTAQIVDRAGVPVLLADGEFVCCYRLDRDRVKAMAGYMTR